MKKFSKILIFMFTIVLFIVLLSTTITAFAKEESSAETYAVTPDPNIGPATVRYKQYNTCVTYNWEVGYRANKINLSRVTYLWQASYDNSYFEYAFPYGGVGSDYCLPNYFYGQSYNSAQDTCSEITTSLEHIGILNGVQQNLYGYNCRYKPTFVLPTATFSSILMFPTSYNDDTFYWEHNGKIGQYIKATIVYNNNVRDIEVKIPLLGYSSTYVLIDGMRFYLRTGPKKCSIKSDTSNIPAYSVKFAFGLS